METFSALLALCAGNSPVTGKFPAQSPVTESFGVFFDMRLNKRLSKQSVSLWTTDQTEPENVYGLHIAFQRHSVKWYPILEV